MIKKLKQRWGINSNFQVILILIVFSVTGSAAVYVKKIIFHWIGIDADTALWIKIPMYVLTILPSYQILLLVIGSLCGQFDFFYNFQKKSFGRFFKKKQVKEQNN